MLLTTALYRSEVEREPNRHRPRLQEVRAAEGRKKVIKGLLVGQVAEVNSGRQLAAAFGVQKVVRADTQIKDIARFDAVGIVVVVLLAGKIAVAALWQREQPGGDRAHGAAWAKAIGNRRGDRGVGAIAGQADGHLLIGGQPQRRTGIGHAADYHAAVVAPGESDPLGILALIAEIGGGLQSLVVIDSEDTAGESRALRHQAADLGEKEAGARVALLTSEASEAA